MSRSSNSLRLLLSYIFGILLGLTVLVWILRGFGVLTFIRGWVILILFLLTIVTGILSRLLASKGGRY